MSLDLSISKHPEDRSLTGIARELADVMPSLGNIRLRCPSPSDQSSLALSVPVEDGAYEVVRGLRPELIVHYELLKADLSLPSESLTRKQDGVHVRFIRDQHSCWWRKGPYRIDLYTGSVQSQDDNAWQTQDPTSPKSPKL
jgi:hypothetical protein